MNKIEVKDSKLNKDLKLDEDTLVIYKNIEGNISFSVDKNIKIFIYLDSSCLDISFDIKENSTLNIFSFNTSLNTNLNLNKENISLNYTYSTLNKDNNYYSLNINHNKEKIKTKIVNRSLNLENNPLDFTINAFVPKTSIGVVTSQDNKILLLKDNNASIKPNLLIDTDDVEAEHSAYIGDFNKEALFYLKSRGIKEKEAKEFLAKSFLIGNMNISYLEREIILNKLEEYWR